MTERAERARLEHRARIVAVHHKLSTPHAFTLSSAAILHGLRTLSIPDRVHVLISQGRATESAVDVERHRFAHSTDELTTVHGLPVTTPRRTVLDAARFTAAQEALVVVDHHLAIVSSADRCDRVRVEAEARQERRALLAEIDRLPRGTRGKLRARAVIEWSSPWSESAFESVVRWIILTWGRRDVVPQLEIWCGEKVYFVDLALRIGTLPDGSPRWLLIEFDGEIKYSGDDDEVADVLARQEAREQDLLAAGHEIVRFRAIQVGHPIEVVTTLASAVGTEEFVAREPVLELMPTARRRARRQRSPGRRPVH
ncbi:type IV toxin-antitoxin system AbiEi family antitoxin [Georgenia sp. Z1344]|uniref:type IV toxin-antitoxin system AbiEi family antitoxin n=1 Tax=Georgenia sp. Z1344 TaxID=3416706 RepID=UPI003CE6B447